MQIRAYDIVYDTDGEEADLPSELTFEAEGVDDPSLELADMISDRTGWCVTSFSFEQVSAPAPSA